MTEADIPHRCQNVVKFAMPPYRCHRCERAEHPFDEMCVVDVDGELFASPPISSWLQPLGATRPPANEMSSR